MVEVLALCDPTPLRSVVVDWFDLVRASVFMIILENVSVPTPIYMLLRG